MKKRLLSLCLSCLYLAGNGLLAQGVPELIYYKFDGTGTTVSNDASTPVGTNPATFVGGLTQGPTGLSGNALIGIGGASGTDYVDTGWPTNLSGDWTIAFWTSNIQPSTTLWYIFGDNTAGSFRCFTNGVAGANNWILRGTGITDVQVTGAATTTGNMVHFVYDGTANEIRAYVDGVLNNTVAQAPGLTISGTGPFKVGAYGTSSGLSPAGLMDEFRIYNRALPLAEIQATFNQPLPLVTGPKDIALSGLLSPSSPSGTCFGSTETIEVNVFSFGTDTLDIATDNIKVTVNVTGPNPQTYTTTLTSGTMNPGSSIPVTLTTAYDMTAGGTYTFDGYVEFVTGGPDANLANDTLATTTVTNFTVSLTLGNSYTEDFETFTPGVPGTGTANGWTILNQGNSGTGWGAEFDGVTNSPNTGPLDDHTPGGQVYMFTEVTGGATGDTANLYTPCLDFTAVSAPKLSFWYHMYGALMGDLNVVVVGGSSTGTDTTIFTISGQQQTAETDPWLEAVVDLSPWAGIVTQINFQAVRGAGFTSDVSLDDVNIFEPEPYDVEGLVITTPKSGCELGATEVICFDYVNSGSDTLTALVASYSIDGGAYITPEAIPGSLLPGASANYCFATTADLSAIGFHDITVVVTQLTPADTNPLNDTITATVETKAVITTFPYFQDFESAAWVPDPNLAPGAPIITLPEGWENLQDDDSQDWAVYQGATSTAFTGPDQDHTTGIGKYLLVDDTGFDNDSVIALTPCFDISALTSPKFSFWYHSNNPNTPTDENELHIDLVYNGSTIYNVIPAIAHKDNNWNQIEIDLSPYPGIVAVRFRVNNNNNLAEHDFAIDDVGLVELLPQDAGIAIIASPTSGCGLLANDSLVLGLANLGTDTIFGGLNINYSINNGTAVSTPFTDTLLPGALIPVSIPNVNFATPGTYEVTAWTSGLLGDTNFFNDSASATIVSSSTIATYPYSEDFEAGPGGWYLEVPVGKASSWELGTPNKQVIQGAASGVNSWVTAVDSTVINLSGVPAEYSNQEEGWISSPCFDFSALAAPTLQLSVWWESETSWDGTVIQYTLDGGLTWLNVGAFGDPDNWYNDNAIDAAPGGSQEGWSGFGADGSGGWVVAKSRMDLLAGEPEVRFRVVFASDQFVTDDGFAFDDIFIFDTPTDDVGAIGFAEPTNDICGEDSMLVSVLLTNFGLDTATNIPVFVDITGAGTASLTGTFPGPLPPGDTATFFVGYFNSSLGGTFALSAYTGYGGDTLLFNDSALTSVDIFAASLAPVVVGDSICATDSAQFTLVATPFGTNTIRWYATATGDSVIAEGDTLITPYLSSTTTYYAEASDIVSYSGFSPVDNTFGGGGNYNFLTDGLVFDALQDMVLNTVKVYPQGAGDIVVNIEDNLGTVIGSVTVPFGGTVVDTTITLDIFVPAGTDYEINASGSTTGGFFRNSSGAVYPYTSTGVVSITGAINNLAAFYYFFYDWTVSSAGCPSPLVPVTAAFLPPADIDLGADAVECSGFELDAFDVSLTSYAWSTGDSTSKISVDSSGLYYIDVINDKGCTGTDSILLTINPTPTVDLGPDITACDSVILDCGNPGAIYVWSEPGQFAQTIVVKTTGEYSVTVNSLGCEATDTIFVTINQGPVLDLGPDLTSCVDVPLDAGNAGATYLWSTGETTQAITVTPPVTGSDTISVSVTNAALCEASDEIIISAGVDPVVDLGPDTSECDSVVLDAGIPGATYTWSSGQTTQMVTVTTSGTYSVDVIDGSGCDATDTIEVTVEAKPTADFTFNNPQYGYTYDFTNISTGGTSYLWDFGDTGTSTDANPTHTYQFAGDYVVTLIATNDCGSDTLEFLLKGVDIDDEAFGRTIEIYPNPTKGEFFISADDFASTHLSVKVTDTRGRVVFQNVSEHVFGGFRIKVDLGAEAEGVYLVEISDGEHTAYKRVIRE